jgi:hypothetical protein
MSTILLKTCRGKGTSINYFVASSWYYTLFIGKGCTVKHTPNQLSKFYSACHEPYYEGESKIIRNVATYCAVGYTAGWA